MLSVHRPLAAWSKACDARAMGALRDEGMPLHQCTGTGAHYLLHLALRLQVERGRRLVEQQHLAMHAMHTPCT